MKDWIKRALTKTTREPPQTIIEPNPKLVYAVKFSIAITLSLTALEITHIAFLHAWNSEIFSAITGLTGTITGIFLTQKA
jgi:hypothetical protein